MSVNVKLVSGSSEEWADGEEDGEYRVYSYELHPSGAVLIHRQRNKMDGLLLVRILEESVIGAIGPAAWENASGTLVKS